MRKIFLFLFCYFLFLLLYAQPLRFAHVTDTHVGGSTGSEDLLQTVEDINSLPDIDFVLFTGDVTEFGSDEELLEAKKIMNRLNKPWYVVPGNHDSKWSESGCNSFVRIFGAEEFCFERAGILFIGTASGPNMRMGPGLVPREQMVFLDSVLVNMKDPGQPIVFVNHYPLDESLANARQVLAKLKTRNIQVSLMGHGHTNKLFNFDSIPGVMGRSNLRAGKEIGGYNLATLVNDTLYYTERIPGGQTLPVWCKVPFGEKNFVATPSAKTESDSLSALYPQVQVAWEFQDNSDIGTGITAKGRYAVYANTRGAVMAIDQKNGKTIWAFQTGGKIYSTPLIEGTRVVCPSTDNTIYCLDLKTGRLQWSFETEKSIVASPVSDGKNVFVGASDGHFRAIDLQNGKLIWQFDGVKNFVETRPLIYDNAIYFGSWGNTFYALDKASGNLLWKREKHTNRMLSPAAVWPVAANGKVFMVAPDRRMTALDAKTGCEIWDSGDYSCRESIGISDDGSLVYIKNMQEGNVNAIFTASKKQEIAWECKAGLGYEIGPSPITERGNLVFVPTGNGVVCAINKQSPQQVAWKYKASDALINYVFPVAKNRVLLTTLDGKVICLTF
ncbi:MAG: PQQ-binding-like beta-propeller repeat protein [Prolixibacteraceae bacterium]|jgi:outer membrane protein assembly factor BamB/predicted phosphodiesterase|nr:PQQ-binding-like beta-propeller repeat protein [Prolixibacteraceae bacterium]